MLRVCEPALRGADLDVVTAADGAGALAAVGAETFDAIVSDIAMPGLTGLELLRAVRERDPDVPVILMAGGTALKIAGDAVAFGASSVLLKPFAPERLVEVARHAISLCRLARVKRRALEPLPTS